MKKDTTDLTQNIAFNNVGIYVMGLSVIGIRNKSYCVFAGSPQMAWLEWFGIEC